MRMIVLQQMDDESWIAVEPDGIVILGEPLPLFAPGATPEDALAALRVLEIDE